MVAHGDPARVHAYAHPDREHSRDRARQVLPDAVHRGGHGFADSFFNGAVVPIRAPLGTLFDVDHLVAWGASVGAVIHSVRM